VVGVLGHGHAGADGLVIGMGVHEKESLGHRPRVLSPLE
jgi:hypothetical protein